MFSRKDLFRLILPLIVEQLLAATIGMMDTLMVSSAGEAAISGVSLVDSINILLINIFSALATGGAIVAAQYLGRGDEQNANRAAKQLLLVVSALSAGITLVCLAFRPMIVHGLFGAAEQAVLDNSLIYFFWTSLSYPFLAVYNGCAALFRSMGNSRISMEASILMNLTNVAGNALLIYAFHMGVAGAAIATLFSRVLGAGIMLVLLRNPHNVIHLDSVFRLGYHPAMIKSILGIGVPTGLENGMFQIGKILVQGLVATLGTTAISANAVSNSIATFALIPGGAIGLAMVTVVGQCVGAGDYRQARYYITRLVALSTALLLGFNAVVALLHQPIIQCFSISEQTFALTRGIVLTHCVASTLIWSLSFTLPNGLRAANDVKFTMAVSVFSMWVFRIGFSYLLVSAFHFTVVGVWLAMYIDWFFRSLLFTFRFLGDKWQAKRLL